MGQGAKCEIVVVGGGLAGYAAALAFSARGLRTTLLAPPTPLDARSTALIGSSLQLLRTAGVLRQLEAAGQPLVAMRIVDDTGRLFRAPTVEFRASEVGYPFFGLNVLNADLLSILRTAAEERGDLLTLVAEPLGDLSVDGAGVTVSTVGGNRFEASLAVGADGRASTVRRLAGIGMRTWPYPQTAIVLNFAHDQDHRGGSTEFHTRLGPVTQVPLPGRQSSLVWVDEPAVAEMVPDLAEERLSELVERKLHSFLGRVEVVSRPQTFSLGGGRVDRLSAPRVALVGEAAHLFPPIGAQGLNLGLRDVSAIVEAATASREDVGTPHVLRSYERARRADVASRSSGIDLLNRSLLSELVPFQVARAAGLGTIAAIGPLRRFAMREGLRPGSGFEALVPRRLPLSSKATQR